MPLAAAIADTAPLVCQLEAALPGTVPCDAEAMVTVLATKSPASPVLVSRLRTRLVPRWDGTSLTPVIDYGRELRSIKFSQIAMRSADDAPSG
jgi:hypothetical protein